MKIFTHNFDPHSNSGPNKFTRGLLVELINKKGVALARQDLADVEFCLIQQGFQKKKPMVLRLDGIYFNSEQDYEKQNAPIKASYENADAVIFQSEFNKKLTEHWFGKHSNSYVVHNAYFGDIVKDSVFKSAFPDKEIWSCASNWRPHKRLVDNIRYYLKWGPKNSVFIVAGDTTDRSITKSERFQISQLEVPETKSVMFYGNLHYDLLRQLYDASSTFVHLAYLDHCPNVVVDAYAHGCKIVCSESGGTREIGEDFDVVYEKEIASWDFSPIKLYKPPEMSLNRVVSFAGENNVRERAEYCLDKYEEIFRSLL